MKYFEILRTIPWFYKGMEVSHDQLKKWYKKEAIKAFEENGFIVHTRTPCVNQCGDFSLSAV